MSPYLSVTAEAAHQMWLVPLGWLAWRRERRMLWWAVAMACACSWLADSAAHVVSPLMRWVASALYPSAQFAILSTALLGQARAVAVLIGGLGLLGAALLLEQPPRPDLFVHLLAWGSLSFLAWQAPIGIRLQVVLLLLFGVGSLAWIVLALTLSLPAWIAYQAIGAAGLGLFCWAIPRAAPRLRLAHG